jgi:hypothetical protein
MTEARLVLTDALVSESLRRAKAAQRAAEAGTSPEHSGNEDQEQFRRGGGSSRPVAHERGE